MSERAKPLNYVDIEEGEQKTFRLSTYKHFYVVKEDDYSHVAGKRRKRAANGKWVVHARNVRVKSKNGIVKRTVYKNKSTGQLMIRKLVTRKDKQGRSVKKYAYMRAVLVKTKN